MPGIIDDGGPSYISSHSADVILSDIRPIKLQVNALRAINVLLDEFLYNILSTACSLSVDRLRASLLSLLPTNLGKEALLEAEVELRAYWDRTGPADVKVRSQEDDAKVFHLHWSFELLRLKCEAYSTLNESDEDPGAESFIHEKMGKEGGIPPKAALVAPAALYLTAILEAMCEHILSNVGRVASRDSSRTNATAQDLFVALCEDHSIYGLFRTMKVYEQIEQLSKAPKGRRSKSFSQTDRLPQSRTSSPYQDQSSNKDSSPVRSRISLEASAAGAAGGPVLTTSGSRSSLEKTRAMKMFMATSRSSNDRDADSQIGHKKSDSIVSEGQTSLYDENEFQDEAMLQEFDDLMRSSSTMKMSLTPDRLKTMEVYKQEKERANRRPVPLAFKSDSDSSVLPSRASGRRPSLLQVDSIKEDDEDSPKSLHKSRGRHGSVSSPPVSASSSTGRVRSVSTSSMGSRILNRKSSRTATPPMPMPFPPSGPGQFQGQNRRVQKGQDVNSFPKRTRKIQQNRESIDLDDVMGGSDDEDTRSALQAKPPTTPRRPTTKHAVSPSTKDLIDFLAEGPPEPPALKFGRNATDIFADGPNASAISMDTGKSRASGRLQRMISKLSLGGSERFRGGTDESPRSRQFPNSVRQNVQPKTSMGNLSSLANRPIPPRPRPISPPPSPSRGSLEDQNYDTSSQKTSNASAWEQKPSDTPLPLPLSQAENRGSFSPLNPLPPLPVHVSNDFENGTPEDFPKSSRSSSARVTSDIASTSISRAVEGVKPSRKGASATSPTRKPVPVVTDVATAPHLSEVQAREMHHLFSKATSAGECRLIFEMFLIKSGITVESTERDVSHPVYSSSDAVQPHLTPADAALEHSVVEFFLGGDSPPEHNANHRQSKKVELDIEILEPCQSSGNVDTEPPTNDGSHVDNGELHLSDDDLPLSDGSVRSSTEELRESGIISSFEIAHVTQNYTLVSGVGA